MDELEIGGKKYLSSRKAARDNKYHTDYIGQLIRAGKIEGKKVGRAWYVEEGSLDRYLKSEIGEVVNPIPETSTMEEIQVIVPIEKNVIDEPVKLSEVETPDEVEKEPMVADVSTKEEIINQPEQKVRITIAERAAPQKKSTLTYIEDTEPFIPQLEGRQRSNADFVPLKRRAEPVEIVEERVEVVDVDSVIEKKPRVAYKFVRFTTLAFIGIVVLATCAGLSSALVTSIQVEEGKPASVALTIK
jgi:hypothetical protein